VAAPGGDGASFAAEAPTIEKNNIAVSNIGMGAAPGPAQNHVII
jgi:hypothetical protein